MFPCHPSARRWQAEGTGAQDESRCPGNKSPERIHISSIITNSFSTVISFTDLITNCLGKGITHRMKASPAIPHNNTNSICLTQLVPGSHENHRSVPCILCLILDALSCQVPCHFSEYAWFIHVKATIFS
uniref:Uncharacterized protein n=1 Tax=Micrurus corallinus TaxID=54390 RepID=A0A2D4GNE6_MICCO